MEKKDNKKLIILVSCLLLVIGVSFSYFVAKTLLSGNGSETKMTTATINGATVRVEGTLEFNDTDIMPGHKIVSGIKVTATGNNELIPYNLIWNGSNNLNTQLNFTVYKTSSELAVNATCEKKTKVEGGIQYLSEECTISNEESLGSIIGSGTISGNTTDTKVNLAKDEFITATSDGSTVYYYVILEYPNLDENQNPDIGSGFNGEVTVEASNTTPDINILAVYIEQEDGTYQESQDIPQEGYVINSEKSTCTNGAIPVWDIINKRFYLDNLTKSGTSCYLYFEIDNTKTSTERIESMGLTATTGSTSFTGIADTDEGLKSGTDDDGTTYYFRGNVTNNWVKFAKFYWRIIRINGDGSIRMIYNGATTDQTGETTQIGTKAFNLSYSDNAYVGYMYGSTGSSTYAATHANTNPSTILGTSSDTTTLLGWYKTNIVDKGYSNKISTDAGFCNDRSIASSSETWWTSDTKKGYGTNATAYGPFSRIIATSNGYNTTQTPSFKCTNASSDLFTSSSSTKGNKKLQYPVGLITMDEALFAGGFGGAANSSYYLYTGQSYWTLSPYAMNTSGSAGVFRVNFSGDPTSSLLSGANGVRPVINLSSSVKLTGTGTASDPFTVVE